LCWCSCVSASAPGVDALAAQTLVIRRDNVIAVTSTNASTHVAVVAHRTSYPAARNTRRRRWHRAELASGALKLGIANGGAAALAERFCLQLICCGAQLLNAFRRKVAKRTTHERSTQLRVGRASEKLIRTLRGVGDAPLVVQVTAQVTRIGIEATGLLATLRQ
jgi:hypothetical protein